MTKLQLSVVALVTTLTACSSWTTTPISMMSDDGITVAYVDGFAGRKDTDKVARMHCAAPTAVASEPVASGTLVDQTAVHYSC